MNVLLGVALSRVLSRAVTDDDVFVRHVDTGVYTQLYFITSVSSWNGDTLAMSTSESVGRKTRLLTIS